MNHYNNSDLHVHNIATLGDVVDKHAIGEGGYQSGYPNLVGSCTEAVDWFISKYGPSSKYARLELIYILYSFSIAESGKLPLHKLHFPRDGWTQASGHFQILQSTQKGIISRIEKEIGELLDWDDINQHAKMALWLIMNNDKRGASDRLVKIGEFCGIKNPFFLMLLGLRMAYISGSVSGTSCLIEGYRGCLHYIPIVYSLFFRDEAAAKLYRSQYVPYFLNFVKDADRLKKFDFSTVALGDALNNGNIGVSPVKSDFSMLKPKLTFLGRCRWWVGDYVFRDIKDGCPGWMFDVICAIDQMTNPNIWDVVISSVNSWSSSGKLREGTHVRKHAIDIIHLRHDALPVNPRKEKLSWLGSEVSIIKFPELKTALLKSPFPHYSRDPTVINTFGILRNGLDKLGYDITVCLEPDHVHLDNLPEMSIGEGRYGDVVVMDYPKSLSFLQTELGIFKEFGDQTRIRIISLGHL